MTRVAPSSRPRNLQLAPFPAELYRRFKAVCALKGLKLYEAGAQAIEAWLSAQEEE